jgi:hypothetical protein
MASLKSHTQTGLDRITAKDSFLKNPELMAMTFSHLKNDATSYRCLFDAALSCKDYRCLFDAALTCKDFLEVALDALWEELDSLVPLLKLLPALQVEDKVYVCANVHVFLYDLILS